MPEFLAYTILFFVMFLSNIERSKKDESRCEWEDFE